MTDTKELKTLMAKMESKGCTVTHTTDRQGYIETISIQGAKGIGPHPMPPISAAERMRGFLARHGSPMPWS